MTKTPKGRALGNALRQAREDHGLTVRSFANQLGRDPGVLSRWETGERTPKPEQVAQILTALGINGEQHEEILSLTYGANDPSWVATSLPAQRQQLAALLDLEQNAEKITEVSPLLIPGLLQTRDYVQAIMTPGGNVPKDEVATRITVRVGRQHMVTGKRPARYTALVGESALHQRIGGRGVMIDQLRQVIDIVNRPNIDFRIIPLNCDWHPGLEGPFLLTESSQSSVVHLENRKSGIFLHEPEDVESYRQAIDFITQISLANRDSFSLIQKIIYQMEQEK